MILPSEYGAVEGIPSGMCACRVDGKNVHIAAISPKSVWLRSAVSIEAAKELTLYFYHPESGNYEAHTMQCRIGEARHENGVALTRFLLDDTACSAAIYRMLNDYARFLEIKSSEGAAAYAQYAVNYPAERDEIFLPDLSSQRRAWFENIKPIPEPDDGVELAVELNCEALWLAYLDHSPEEFMRVYAGLRQIPRNALPHRLPNRLYIGNAFCRHVFPEPEILDAIMHKAAKEKLLLTLVSAELRSGGEDAADRLFEIACAHGAELVVNDWGMLERAQDLQHRPALLLGTQLNRRRKDPRMGYKAGLRGNEHLLCENALNDASWRAFLREMGIARYEYESCALPIQAAGDCCSLHMPFYQTNTSLWCPLRALCSHGDRGRQEPALSCPKWCEENAVIYPAHLNMLGRWNSLLALDADPTAHARGFDRWVLNF